MTPRQILKILAWLTAALILVATVCPIEVRPRDILPVDLDRALAFALLSALFMLGYPRHFWLLSIILVATAAGAETLQFLAPTRHAHLDDAVVKAIGAAAGAVIGLAVNKAWLVLRPDP